MSRKITNLCPQREFGSPVRKHIIVFLADIYELHGSLGPAQSGWVMELPRDPETGDLLCRATRA